MGGKCSNHGRNEYAHKILVGRPEEKRPRVRHGRRWENNIIIILGK